MKKFIVVCLALLALGLPAYAVTPPYQYIAPTGNATTDTAALNAALPTCAAGQAIFILPGSLTLSGTIDLRPYPGCSISSTIVGTAWDSAQGTQSTTIGCNSIGSAPCFTMGNSQVMQGLHIYGSGSNNCFDLSSSPASGNLFLNIFADQCNHSFDINPSTCCSQNNRALNLYVLGGNLDQNCGNNCQFNQFSDVEDEGAVVGTECSGSCSNIQYNNFRSEDNALGLQMFGTDTIVTNYLTSREQCAQIAANNFILLGGRCGGVGGGGPLEGLFWNVSGPISNVIVRDYVVSYGFTYVNQYSSGTFTCNNCMLDIGGAPYSMALYASSVEEAALDWQRPVTTNYLAPYTLTGTTTSAAPDFQWSPNQYFLLCSACANVIANPVYAHDGQGGLIELQQPATGTAATVSWSGQYTATTGAVLNATLGSTTFYPYTVSGTQVILGNSYHN